MEDSQAFARRLEEKLEAKRSRLDRVELVKMKEACKIFQAAFLGMSAVLHKKGVLGEDPYKYELKISDVTTPSESAFPESEKADQMSVRVSQFEAYLDFLNNYYQFSCDFLTMGRLKRVLALIKYFNFQQFTETSTSLNTRALAEIAGMVKKGTDQLSSGLIGDSVAQLDKATKDILACIKELTAYHRERYKLEIRQIVLPGVPIDEELVAHHREEAVRLLKRKFAEVAAERPFYPELVDELMDEDFSASSATLREAVLTRLAVAEEKKSDEKKERSYRGVVLDGIRSLSSASFSLGEAVAKAVDNSSLLASLEQGLGARLRRMIRKLFAPEDKGLIYEISFVDPVTGSRSEEKLDFGLFSEEAANKARFLSSLAQRGGNSARRLDGMTDDQAFAFLQRNIEEIQRTLRILAALEDYFRFEAPAELKPKIKTIRPEMSSIKGAVIKANQKKHEYVAQREELEQMKRLGIQDPS